MAGGVSLAAPLPPHLSAWAAGQSWRCAGTAPSRGTHSPVPSHPCPGLRPPPPHVGFRVWSLHGLVRPPHGLALEPGSPGEGAWVVWLPHSLITRPAWTYGTGPRPLFSAGGCPHFVRRVQADVGYTPPHGALYPGEKGHRGLVHVCTCAAGGPRATPSSQGWKLLALHLLSHPGSPKPWQEGCSLLCPRSLDGYTGHLSGLPLEPGTSVVIMGGGAA